ncbi:hypothetical protein [Acidimangrovimonas sediminis]|uniref:hypothetical protein n=1 Tax=Acidimangrovimonas sediminis TaxID=2056283 RepID=UPI0011AF1BF6|nr:hypothetical protein [Acidimangrovimonas sediminis]
MARAGDGKLRSEKRKAAHVIAFRVTAEQLDRVKRTANAWGYENHTEFARDIALRQNAVPQRPLAQVRARLAKIHNILEESMRSSVGTNKALHEILEAMQAELRIVFRAISGDKWQ